MPKFCRHMSHLPAQYTKVLAYLTCHTLDSTTHYTCRHNSILCRHIHNCRHIQQIAGIYTYTVTLPLLDHLHKSPHSHLCRHNSIYQHNLSNCRHIGFNSLGQCLLQQFCRHIPTLCRHTPQKYHFIYYNTIYTPHILEKIIIFPERYIITPSSPQISSGLLPTTDDALSISLHKGKHTCISHLISNFITYNYLSFTHTSFIINCLQF